MLMIDGEIASIAAMKKQAVKNMQALGLDDKAIKSFEKDNKVYCSEGGYLVEVPGKIKQKIYEYEKTYGFLVYHVIHSILWNYETYECLYVSCYEEDWAYDDMLTETSWVMSHSENLTVPDFTEAGSIKVKNYNNTLVRIN